MKAEHSLKGLLLKLKLWYLAIWCEELTYGKGSDDGKDWRQKEKSGAEDEMVR